MLGYLFADIICSEKRTVFGKCTLTKTVSYDEQIMSKDKFASIFSPKMEAIRPIACKQKDLMDYKSYTRNILLKVQFSYCCAWGSETIFGNALVLFIYCLSLILAHVTVRNQIFRTSYLHQVLVGGW